MVYLCLRGELHIFYLPFIIKGEWVVCTTVAIIVRLVVVDFFQPFVYILKCCENVFDPPPTLMAY